MELTIEIFRNGDVERPIGNLSADYGPDVATILDVGTLKMDAVGIPEFALLILQDDEWQGQYESGDGVWAWQQEHGLTGYGGRRQVSGFLVEGVAAMFPETWLPIGLRFSDGHTVWSKTAEEG